MRSYGIHFNSHAMEMGYMLKSSEMQHDDYVEPVDDLAALAVQLRAATAAKIPVVYAALRAEHPVVKIGFSTHLAGRTGRLRSMPDCKLVAVTPGGRAEERAAHDALTAHRVTVDLPGQGATEHFVLCDEVAEWINQARYTVNLRPITLDQMLTYSR